MTVNVVTRVHNVVHISSTNLVGCHRVVILHCFYIGDTSCTKFRTEKNVVCVQNDVHNASRKKVYAIAVICYLIGAFMS